MAGAEGNRTQPPSDKQRVLGKAAPETNGTDHLTIERKVTALGQLCYWHLNPQLIGKWASSNARKQTRRPDNWGSTQRSKTNFENLMWLCSTIQIRSITNVSILIEHLRPTLRPYFYRVIFKCTYFMCMCFTFMYVHTPGACLMPLEARKKCCITKLKLQPAVSSCGCWEAKPSPLAEQPMLWTTEPSLQPLKAWFSLFKGL